MRNIALGTLYFLAWYLCKGCYWLVVIGYSTRTRLCRDAPGGAWNTGNTRYVTFGKDRQKLVKQFCFDYANILHEFRFDAVKDMKKKQLRFCHQFSLQILILICLSYSVDSDHSGIVHSLHRPNRGSGYCGLRPPPITKGRDETARDWWQRRSRTYFWLSSLWGLGI